MEQSAEIPGYQLQRRIGRGGMAEVWLAVQASLGREVALKILAPAMARDDTMRERFLQEARIAAQLHHPNIIAIYDVGTYGDTAYIAMEYEPGGTVSPAPGTTIEPDAALAIVRDIVEALDYAHQQGVVHRDVKPDNILRRANGRCLLSDFGIARIMDADTVLTREGTSVGTPQYMSPEQLRGDKLDGRSDFYSLGVVLYQLLTGALPYSGSDGWAIGMQHIGAEIPRLPPSLARLQPLIDALMAKSPKDRPQRGAEIIVMLDALRAVTAPTSVAPRQRRIERSQARPVAWIAAALLLPVLAWFGYTRFAVAPDSRTTTAGTLAATSAGAAAGKTTPAAPPDAAPATQSIAVLPLANQSGDQQQLFFSDGLSEDLTTALAQFDQLRVIGSHSAFQFRDSKEDSRTIGARLGVAHLLQGSVRKAGDTVRVTLELINASDGSALWSQHYDRPYKDLFKLQDEITAAVAGALKARLTDAAQAAAQSDRPRSGRLDAYAAYLQGVFHKRPGNEASLRESVAQFRDAIRLDPDYALAHAELSRSLTALANNYLGGTAAADLYAESKAQADRALALDPQLAVAHYARGYRLLVQEFDWRGAEFEFREAARLAPSDGKAKAQLGHVLMTQGRPEEAVPLFEAALQSDPLEAFPHVLLANSLMAMGRLDDAEQHLRRALALQPGATGLFAGLSLLEIVRGRPQAALAAARREPVGPYREFAETLALQVAGSSDAADSALSQLIKQRSEILAYQIAEIYALRKDPDQAFAWLERARRNNDGGVVGMLTDPLLAPLKKDPRFAAFAREVGLPAPR